MIQVEVAENEIMLTMRTTFNYNIEKDSLTVGTKVNL